MALCPRARGFMALSWMALLSCLVYWYLCRSTPIAWLPTAASLPMPSTACCYPGIRCGGDYNIFVVSNMDPRNHMDAVLMMRPMWETVFRGLLSRSEECGYRVFLQLAHHVEENFRFSLPPASGDVVILVGHEGGDRYLELCRDDYARRKIYCIWYFSEHVQSLHPKSPYHRLFNKTKPSGLCEIWHYTHGNPPAPVPTRYIPAGFLPKQLLEENDELVAANVEHLRKYPPKQKPNLTLKFVGKTVTSASRVVCWTHLQQVSAFQNFDTAPVWRLEEWITQAHRKQVIYLNMHRPCNETTDSWSLPLETVRLSPILSMGGIVVSERTNPNDTLAWQDIVLFEPNLFLPFERWSPRLRRLLTTPPALGNFQSLAYRTFKEEYHPKTILLNAKVWDGGAAC